MAGENSLGYSSSGTHLVRFLREIPEFSGAMSVQQGGRSVFNNPLSWLKQLSRLQELAGIGDKEALLIARDHLTGKAEKWYDRSCSNVKTWSEFTTRFKEKFCSGHEDYWWAEIANTKQGSDEDVEDVDIKLRELFSLVGVTDEKLKIRSFMDAINPAVAWEVERSEDMTKLTKMEDVVNAAVRAEGVIKKYRSKGVAIVGPPVVRQNQEVLDYDSNTFGDNRSVKSSSTMDDLLKEFRDLKISIVKTVNGSASNNSPRKFTCFYCKKEGHRKMDCPEFLKSKQDKEISPVTGSNAIPLNSVKEAGPRRSLQVKQILYKRTTTRDLLVTLIQYPPSKFTLLMELVPLPQIMVVNVDEVITQHFQPMKTQPCENQLQDPVEQYMVKFSLKALMVFLSILRIMALLVFSMVFLVVALLFLALILLAFQRNLRQSNKWRRRRSVYVNQCDTYQ